MQTTVIFKADKRLKKDAQKTAKRMGVPFSAVMNSYLRSFVERQEVTFSNSKPLVPTPYLARILEQGERDLITGKNIKRFNSVDELFDDLEDRIAKKK